MFPALLDSCVIFPMPLRDTLFRAAENDFYRPHWSQEILDGATRNLVKTGRMTNLQARRFQAKIKEAFPEAIVEVPAKLIEIMTNHPGDRHVVAAAIVARAEIIVTSNLKHFPAEALIEWGIEAQHPDVFLNCLYEGSPDLMIQVVRRQAEALKHPLLSTTELLDKLSKQVPKFANRVRLDQQNIESQ